MRRSKNQIPYTDLRELIRPGKASELISSFNVWPGRRVIISCRVSTEYQGENGNLTDQESNLRDAVQKAGGVVVKVIYHVGPGWDIQWLECASQEAIAEKAVLLFETIDRIIRSRRYTKNRQDVLPTVQDFNWLRLLTTGATLMTLENPDASPVKNRACQTKRGQRVKDRRGGRPLKPEPGSKKRFREDHIQLARSLRKRGLTLRRIAWWIYGNYKKHSTIQGWFNRKK